MLLLIGSGHFRRSDFTEKCLGKKWRHSLHEASGRLRLSHTVELFQSQKHVQSKLVHQQAQRLGDKIHSKSYQKSKINTYHFYRKWLISSTQLLKNLRKFYIK